MIETAKYYRRIAIQNHLAAAWHKIGFGYATRALSYTLGGGFNLLDEATALVEKAEDANVCGMKLSDGTELYSSNGGSRGSVKSPINLPLFKLSVSPDIDTSIKRG
jgi:hypothetical protein